MDIEEKIIKESKDSKVSRGLENIRQFREKFYSYLTSKGYKPLDSSPRKLYQEIIKQIKK